MTRLMLELTNLDTGKTAYITVSDPDATLPDLVAKYAKSYARTLLGQPTEAVPMRLAMFPGGDEETDDAA